MQGKKYLENFIFCVRTVNYCNDKNSFQEKQIAILQLINKKQSCKTVLISCPYIRAIPLKTHKNINITPAVFINKPLVLAYPKKVILLIISQLN